MSTIPARLTLPRDDRPIPMRSEKQRAVLSVLLLRANRTVSTERLIDEVWGGDGGVNDRTVTNVVLAIRHAIVYAYRTLGIVCEASAAPALAALLDDASAIRGRRTVVLISAPA